MADGRCDGPDRRARIHPRVPRKPESAVKFGYILRMSDPEIPPGHLKMRPAVEVGPELEDSGDPQWIQPEYAAGGALPGDGYLSYGRWRERIPPTATHPADLNPRTMCRAGLRQALRRLFEAMSLPHSTVAAAGPVDDDPTVRAIIATYDALEWVHTFNEYARAASLYRNATDLDPVNGSFVEGAIGARNASHHGMRRVIGIVEVKGPTTPLPRIGGSTPEHTEMTNLTARFAGSQHFLALP